MEKMISYIVNRLKSSATHNCELNHRTGKIANEIKKTKTMEGD